MKDNRHFVMMGLAILALAVSACDTPAGGRWPQEGGASMKDAPKPAQREALEALSLKASAEKGEYVLGEPIWIYVILENTSSRPLRVWGKLRPEEGAVSILIGGEGQEGSFAPLGRSDNDETALVELGPGKQIGDTFPVFFGSGGWTFRKPGEYQLKLVYETPLSEGKFGRISSEPFTVKVTDDKVGAALVNGDEASLEAGKFLLWQAGDHLKKGQAMLADLGESHAGSPLASYAHFALGRSLSEPFMDYTRNEVRPPDCERAVKHLSEVDPEIVGALVRVLTEIAGARCSALEEQPDAAREGLVRAREMAEDRPELGRLLGRIAEYEINLADAPEG